MAGPMDAPNAIATVVSMRVLGPRRALGMAAVLNTLSAMSGTAVGATIGKGFVKTMGLRLTKLDSLYGFAAETAAASAIELASRLGILVRA